MSDIKDVQFEILDYKTQYQKILYNFVISLKKLSNESNDESDPNNYITNIGDTQHTSTYLQKYIRCIKMNKISSKSNHHTSGLSILNDTYILCNVNYPILIPKYDKNDKLIWRFISSVEDRKKCKTYISQYSCPSTNDYYKSCIGLTIDELQNKCKSKEPLTAQIDKLIEYPYQKINWKYIEFIIDMIGSNFIPDICKKIIEDMKTITPDRAVDIFHCNSIEYAFFIQWLSKLTLSSNMEQINKIYRSTRNNITFVPQYMLNSVTKSTKLKTLQTNELFNFTKADIEVRYVGSDNDSDDEIINKTESIIIQCDFIKYCNYYINICKSYKYIPIDDSTISLNYTSILNSHEDLLNQNKLYAENSDFIKFIIDKSKQGFTSMIVKSLPNSEAMSGIINKISPLLKFLS